MCTSKESSITYHGDNMIRSHPQSDINVSLNKGDRTSTGYDRVWAWEALARCLITPKLKCSLEHEKVAKACVCA